MDVVVLVEGWLGRQRVLGEDVPAWWARRGGTQGWRAHVVGALEDHVGHADVVADGAVLDLDEAALRRALAGEVVLGRDEHGSVHVVAASWARRVEFGRRVVPGGASLGLRAQRAVDAPSLNALVDLMVRRARTVLQRVAVLPGDPEAATIVISPSVTVEPGAELWPNVSLLGSTHVSAGAVVRTGCQLTDTWVGPGVVIEPYTVAQGAHLGQGVHAGPFAHLRPGTRLEAGVKVGNFVETKAAHLQEGAKANHLSYLGDCEIGAGTNIGAGTITCNYDGARKHRTVIGAGAFVGTNSSLVAPLEVGDGALIAAGSTITEGVPAGALALGRARQAVIPGRGAEILEANRAAKRKAEAER